MKLNKVINELIEMQIEKINKELINVNEEEIEEKSYLISLRRSLKKQLEEITTKLQIEEEETKINGNEY